LLASGGGRDNTRKSISQPVDIHRSQHRHRVAAINSIRPMRSRNPPLHTMLTTRRAL
jgi:hypothetical protein